MGSKDYELYKEELKAEKEKRLANVQENKKRWEGLTCWQAIKTIAKMSATMSLILSIFTSVISLICLIVNIVYLICKKTDIEEIAATTLLVLICIIGEFIAIFVVVFLVKCIGMLIELILDSFGIAHGTLTNVGTYRKRSTIRIPSKRKHGIR